MMTFSCRCEHPRIIYNSTLGKYIAVRCGHCNTCRRTTLYNKRKQAENANAFYKFMAMITLTYNEENLPTIPIRYYNDAKGRQHAVIGKDQYNNDDLIITSKELRNLRQLTVKNKRGNFLRLTQRPQKLPTINVADVQRYMKRLRKNIAPQSLKFMALAEYGGVTLRPHYHIIVWTNELETIKKLRHDYHSKWNKGRTSWTGISNCERQHRKNLSQYVAGYVCQFVTLSKLYEQKTRRPKIWGSCGLYCINHRKHLADIYSAPAAYFNGEMDNRTGVARTYDANVSRAILPRCANFDELPDDCRALLYKAADCTTAEEIYKRATHPETEKRPGNNVKEETIELILQLINTPKIWRRIEAQKEAIKEHRENKKERTKILAAIRSRLHASKIIQQTAQSTGIPKNKLIKTCTAYHEERDATLLRDKLQSLQKQNDAELTAIIYYTTRPITELTRVDDEHELQKRTASYYRQEIQSNTEKMQQRAKHREYNENILKALQI